MYRKLKAHFDTPGCAQTESLNQLALGLDRKKAACLFYQNLGIFLRNMVLVLCILVLMLKQTNIIERPVLATRDIIKVHQKDPYGNIVISRGAKM
ncbi:putative rad21/Rec8-like protein [Helianthus anomalus]